MIFQSMIKTVAYLKENNKTNIFDSITFNRINLYTRLSDIFIDLLLWPHIDTCTQVGFFKVLPNLQRDKMVVAVIAVTLTHLTVIMKGIVDIYLSLFMFQCKAHNSLLKGQSS